MTKRTRMFFLVIVGISVLVGALSELLHYHWLWDYTLGGAFAPYLFYYVVPGIFLILSVLFDIGERGKPRGKAFGTASHLFFLFATSLHFVIMTLPHMRFMDECPIKWWFWLLLPLLIEFLLAHMAHFLFERNPKLFLVIKYTLFVLVHAYGFLIYWAYGMAGPRV